MESGSSGFVDFSSTVAAFSQTPLGNYSSTTSFSTSFSTSPNSDNSCLVFSFFLNTVILGLLCIFGFAGNTISIFVLQRDRHNRVPVFLLQSLAVADNSVLCLSFIALSIFYGLLPMVNPGALKDAKHSVVRYVNPLGTAAQSCAIWITVLLALNRYTAICRPFNSWKWQTIRLARMQVLIVVTFSVLLNIPRVFEKEIQDIGKATTTTTTRDTTTPTGYGSNNWSTPSSSNGSSSTSDAYWYFELIYQNAFYTSVVLILPLFLLVGFNIPLMRQLQKSKRKMISNSLSYSGQQENNITFVMIIIILEMVVCHSPDRVVQVIRVIQNVDKRKCPLPLFYVTNIANFLVMLSSSTNFIVYYVFRKRFRTILLDRLCCRRPRSNSRDFDASNSRTDLPGRPLVKLNSNGNGNRVQRVEDNDLHATLD